jgi:hypothetical protein
MLEISPSLSGRLVELGAILGIYLGGEPASAPGAAAAPSGCLAELGACRGVHSGGSPVSASGATASPSGSLGPVAFGFHLLKLPDIIVGWRGFAFRGCLLLHLGWVSATVTGAAA